MTAPTIDDAKARRLVTLRRDYHPPLTVRLMAVLPDKGRARVVLPSGAYLSADVAQLDVLPEEAQIAHETAISEAAWQEQVIELAQTLGWSHMHVRRSIGKGRRWTTATNVTGWPDLTLWHPRHGVVFAELKTDTGKTTAEQDEVLGSLAAAGQTVAVWRPSDLDGEVLAVLRGAGDCGRWEK